MTDKLKSIADRLQGLVRDSGKKAREIASITGVPPENISRYLNAKRMLNSNNLMALARFFRVNPNWLLTGEGPMRLDPTLEGGYNPNTRNAVGDEPMSDNERNLYERIFALQSENADLKIRLARMEAELQGKSERQGRRDVG